MPRTIKKTPLQGTIDALDSEFSSCVQDYHRSTCKDKEPVIRLKTVEKFAKHITTDSGCLADSNTFSTVAVLVKQLMESNMVRYDESEKERIFEILTPIKELIETVRGRMRETSDDQ